MPNEAIPVHKLILLYIAGQAPGIRLSRLRDAGLATLSMDYLDLAGALEDLTASGLIQVTVRDDKLLRDAEDREIEICQLTVAGRSTSRLWKIRFLPPPGAFFRPISMKPTCSGQQLIPLSPRWRRPAMDATALPAGKWREMTAVFPSPSSSPPRPWPARLH